MKGVTRTVVAAVLVVLVGTVAREGVVRAVGSTIEVTMDSTTVTSSSSVDFDLQNRIELPASWSSTQPIAAEVSITSSGADDAATFRGSGGCIVDLADNVASASSRAYGSTASNGSQSLTGVDSSVFVINDRSPQLSIYGPAASLRQALSMVRVSCTALADLAGKYVRVGAVPAEDPETIDSSTAYGGLYYLFSTNHYYRFTKDNTASIASNYTRIGEMIDYGKSLSITVNGTSKDLSGSSRPRGWVATVSTRDEIVLTTAIADLSKSPMFGVTDVGADSTDQGSYVVSAGNYRTQTNGRSWTWDTSAWGSVPSGTSSTCTTLEGDYRWLGPDTWCQRLPTMNSFDATTKSNTRYWSRDGSTGAWSIGSSSSFTIDLGSTSTDPSAATFNGINVWHNWAVDGSGNIEEPNASGDYIYWWSGHGWDDADPGDGVERDNQRLKTGTRRYMYVEFCSERDAASTCDPPDVAVASTQILAAQTIDFPNPGTQTVGFTLVGSASSGLDVSYASSTPSVCTVSGSDVEKVANGTCTITASQAGNATWNAASSVERSFAFQDDPATLISWSIDSRTQSAPTAATGSCTAGTSSAANSGSFRTVRFRAPASGGGSCTFTPPAGVTHVEVLLVGGGGAGGYDAGGGGGGGAMVYHSALPVSGAVTITIGAGGAASSSSASWAAKAGGSGGNSSVTAGGTTLTANGGGGGNGCRWSGSICSVGGESNSGGAGGTASGGTMRANGGSGGNGVWTSASGSCSSKSCPGNGADGGLWHILGTALNLGGGGGGSGASATPGSGGTGGGASGTSGAGSPSAGTAGTGGGGAGGNGVAGSNGGSGTVIIRFATSMATNNASPSVRPVFSGTNASGGALSAGASTSNGTVKRQYATLTSGSCGASWTTESASITTFPDATELVRGRCYRWSYDDGVAASASRPSDSAGTRPTANLTSPVLLLPVASTVTAPASLPVDPSATTKDLLVRVTAGDDDVRICLYPTTDSVISGTGTAAGSGLTFDVGANGTTDASASSTTVSGDRSAAASLTGTRTNLNVALASVRVSASSGAVVDGGNVLLRSVPVVSGFTTSCDPSASADLRPVTGGSAVVDLVVFTKRTAVRGTVTVD